MKKFFAIFSLFMFLSFNANTLTVRAQPLNIKLSEGIYTMKDLKLLENTEYNIQNTSPGTVFLIVVDGNQQIMESRRLTPDSIKYNIGPLKYNDKIVVLGPGTVTLTE